MFQRGVLCLMRHKERQTYSLPLDLFGGPHDNKSFARLFLQTPGRSHRPPSYIRREV